MAEPPPDDPLAGPLARNIEAVARRRAEDAAGASRGVRLSARLGRVIGRMGFVYANLVFYGGWLAGSMGMIPGVPRFDRDLYLVGSVASIEALFLAILILIAQNHDAAANDRRDELNLQVSLLVEHEITQLIKVTAAIAARLGIDPERHGEIGDLQHDIKPEAVLDRIEAEEPDAGV